MSRAADKAQRRQEPVPTLILTCEHGGNQIPAAYRSHFRGAQAVLQSHRGHDPGALELARKLSRELKAPLHFSQTSRLLVELNRTLGHPRVFSEFTRDLPDEDRAALLREFYEPYRRAVEAEITHQLQRGPVVHVSVHSFTPVMNGKTRRTEIGLLFDPSRSAELEFCTRWKRSLKNHSPELAVHFNLPYRGTSDGFTTALRKLHPDPSYAGIEIEVNQKFPLSDAKTWRELQAVLSRTLVEWMRDERRGKGTADS